MSPQIKRMVEIDGRAHWKPTRIDRPSAGLCFRSFVERDTGGALTTYVGFFFLPLSSGARVLYVLRVVFAPVLAAVAQSNRCS